MSRLPTLFVSHGSPMLAVNPGRTGAAWHSIATTLPKPRAILVVSAHWLSAEPILGSVGQPDTIHDFGGFPADLFQIQYRPPGEPDLAARAAAMLAAAGFPVSLDAVRGLDHGAWVPLMNMYPAADIPVLQLSIQPRANPGHHFRLGKALAGLRDEGVLLLASGSLTHNLRELSFGAPEGVANAQYVLDFQEWVHERLQADDLDALLDYRQQAPAAARAHPSDEHLLPLFVALGAAGEKRRASRLYSGITEGGLAMDTYAFDQDQVR
ncbi:dioxygenase [Chitinimonas arctica]|uniref:Dioxygenase n=1 Tax=Chitinimonas arctica TaxID=2594795 RepID=A0A516SCD6_9NEIS|nr:class III extradiol ring-cleavage dioxygenase [Chitinimonas arctica]QDQ25811.1 dioxygenase [Chitinimonas arctica]